MKFSISFIIILFTMSCTSMYVPTPANIPLLENKKDFHCEIGVNTNSFALNGAYALTSKYAFILNTSASYGNFFEFYDLIDLYSNSWPFTFGGEGNHWNSEIGFGYFKKNKILFELYSGINYGHYYLSSSSNYKSFFVQSNVGLKKTKHIETAFSGKIIISDYNYNYMYNGSILKNEHFPVIAGQLSSVFRVGGESLKFWLTPSVYVYKSFNNNLEEIDNSLYFSPNVTIGLSYRFSHKK